MQHPNRAAEERAEQPSSEPNAVGASFTPGPWAVETPMGDADPWIVEANKQTHEWHCLAIIPADGGEEEVPTSEAMANAQLIAAAPALLDAAKEAFALLACTELQLSRAAAAQQLSDAIFAATGGRP